MDRYLSLDRAVDAHRAQLLELSHRLHANPELRFEEHRAAGWLCAALDEAGFSVERGVGGLPTAFRATLRGGGDGPKVALLCEYDALEGLGHACGHNLIATMSLGAALALAPRMRDLPGSLLVLGTPGEEGGGGKVILLEQGVFEGVDAALMLHPFDADVMGAAMLARVAWEVVYSGAPAHAAAAPHLGVNALDAVRLAFAGLDAMRQQVPPDVRIHGVISHGGDAPNIIPHRAAMKLFLRAGARDYLEQSLVPRAENVLRGAALMTGCTVAVEEIAKPYDNFVVNPALADRFRLHAERCDRRVEAVRDETAGSSDIGNVSQRLPCLHAFIAIDDEAKPHTVAFAEAARSERGDRAVVDGARILAGVALDLLRDPDVAAQVAAGR